ncbi:RHS repeat-associated core domain-containing protein [Catenuloplanes niger JCM 9533]
MRGLAAFSAIIVSSTLLQVVAQPATAAPGLSRPATQEQGEPVRGVDGTAKPRPVNPVHAMTATPATVAWPAAGTAEVAVTAGAKPVAVGGMSVSVKAPAGRSAAAAARSAPDRVRVQTLDRATSARAGVDGPVVRVGAVAGKSTGSVRLSLSYAGFADAFGGDYGARLRLVRLPECALTTPNVATCLPVPLQTENDAQARTLSADVPSSSLIAAAAAEASAQGSYAATSLSPSSKWNVANSSGAFSWSYPMRVPPVPGGEAPGVTLSYSSQTVDGRTSATNNQGSWIGEGFAFEPGFIERSYKACVDDGHDAVGDLCWAYDNATISLAGRSGKLIKSGNAYKLSSDDGTKIERLTGATNGDSNGEHWKVTTVDGTQYFFGLNRLPGWSSDKQETNSAWTVPVYSDDAGEPCYNATFANAACTEGWRWNLDYVKDLHGNVVSYFYQKEFNYYAKNAKFDVNGTRYDRGGYLTRVDYGQKDGAVYSTNAPARVHFKTDERCLPTSTVNCAPGSLNAGTATSWPDVPWDRNCAENTKCTPSQASPSFWTRKRLTSVTTEIRGASTWTPVDAWDLTHTFTNNADGSRSLWLHKIQHRGLAGGTVTMPSVELGPKQLPNRIDNGTADNIAPLIRPRLTLVLNDTGGQVDVNYKDADCAIGSLPTSESSSTKRCYPVKWNPTGEKEPITDWFHKYVVDSVIETDNTGGAPDMVTSYEYLGNAGWKKEEPNGLSDAKYLTWSDWRGYAHVQVRQGNGQITTTRGDHFYLRGLGGTVTDSVGTVHTDHDELVGFGYETQAFDGATMISKTVTSPWRHETAAVQHSWGWDRSFFVSPASERGFTALESGGWRETKTITTYETALGRVTSVDEHGDVAVTGDEKCTRTTYADNPNIHLYQVVSQVEGFSVLCSATPNRATQLLTHDRNYHDGSTVLGAAPSRGDVTRTEKLATHDGTTATFVPVASTVYDGYGRPVESRDGVGTLTKTAYTEINGLTALKVETSPAPFNFVTTTEYEPAWGLPKSQSDPNGRKTEMAYDAIGRLVSVWNPDRSRGAGTTPSIKYSYTIQAGTIVSTKTEKIEADGVGYGAEYTLYDGFLRPRQTQSEGPEGGRLVADTFYTHTGQLAKVNDTYFAAGAPSGALLTSDGTKAIDNGLVDLQTAYTYDGADRVKVTTTLVSGQEKWHSTTRYGGDRVHVDPVAGETPTTRITDARGALIELRQYHGSTANGAFDATTYTYNVRGQQATVTDPEGNVWRYFYDQRGRKIKSEDPDAGTSTIAYNDLDRPVTTTNGNGESIHTEYDVVGRPLATYAGTDKTGTKLTEYTYDTVAKGEMYTASRIVNGSKFMQINSAFDVNYRPTEVRFSFPKAEVGDALGGTYIFHTAYNADGSVKSTTFPASGGLPGEGVIYSYDDLQRLTGIRDATSTILTKTSYGQTGELLQAELNTGGKKAWQTFEYEEGTSRLVKSRLDREGAPVIDFDQRYTYDASGNVERIEDKPAGGQTDIQCFTYDYLRRMTEARSTADTCESGTVGGPAAYRSTYTYDKAGNRVSETQHGIGGAASVTRDYVTPEPGAARPHALTQVTEKTISGDRLHTYEYDAAGNMTKRVQVGEEQTFDWNAEGKLDSVTKAGQKTSYIYDASGNRIVRKEPGATTLYVGGMELKLKTATGVVDGTRYYPVGSGAVVVRTVAGTFFEVADHHGTGQASIDATTGAITMRRSTPFGTPRGTQPASWSSEKGFVGGTQDSSTGLTHLGAREYDPAIGRFISVDPIIDSADPQQMHGYAYGNNNPTSYSDPDGLRPLVTEGGHAEEMFHKTNNTQFKKASNGKFYLYDRPSGKKATTANIGGYSVAPTPTVDPAVARAQAEAEAARQMVISVAKELGVILMEELGITDALDCFTKGDLGGCAATAVTVLTSFIGGLPAKLAAKYGLRWGKAAALGKRLYNLGGKLIEGAQKWIASRKRVDALGSCLTSGRPNSFTPGTLVLMANGTTKPIEDVEVGDQVLATQPETGETAAKTVVATIVGSGEKSLVRLTVDTDGDEGDSVDEITATDNHPFWIPEAGEWLQAIDLQPGQWLQTSAGTWVQITAVSRWTQSYQQVRNLTVGEIHTYYVVVGSTSVLVHNCGDEYDGLHRAEGESSQLEDYEPQHLRPEATAEVPLKFAVVGAVEGATDKWSASLPSKILGYLPEGNLKTGLDVAGRVAYGAYYSRRAYYENGGGYPAMHRAPERYRGRHRS